jgi:hypothetical protein
MRLSHSLILAGALFVAAPALAQDNTVTPANAVTTNAAESNTVATTPTATPANQNDTLAQAAAEPEAAAPATTPARPSRGFPWGVLGLLGLIGLFGVRKVKG